MICDLSVNKVTDDTQNFIVLCCYLFLAARHHWVLSMIPKTLDGNRLSAAWEWVFN